MGPQAGPAGFSARPPPPHTPAPSASSRSPEKPVHVLDPFGKVARGRGGVKGIRTPGPLQGHGRLYLFRPLRASPPAGLPERSSLPSGAGGTEPAARRGAGAGIARCSPFAARRYRPVRRGADCGFRPRRRPQSRSEEAKWRPVNFRPRSRTPDEPSAVPAGALGAEAGPRRGGGVCACGAGEINGVCNCGLWRRRSFSQTLEAVVR